MARFSIGRLRTSTTPQNPIPVIICFAGDLWDGNPHSRHHLMRRLAGRWEILFVEGVPMRSVTTIDRMELARIAAKLRARTGLRTVAPRLHALRTWPIPPIGPAGRVAQLVALRWQISAARRRLALRGPTITWISLPVAAPLVGHLGERGSIFYYQDRYDAFSHVDAPRMRRHVEQLVRKCDLAVTSAESLADDLRALGAQPLVVPHGVDIERFAGEPAPPTDLDGLERPLVGCVGLIDDYVDFDAVRAVADSMERGTVVMVGAANTDLERLEHPRIRILGQRPYADVPGYLAAFACCLVPFVRSRLTVGVNPIKLREYLAAGRPTVATDLPEITPYADVVAVCATPHAFAAAVQLALAPGADDETARARRRARVAGDTWDAAAAAIERQLDQLLAQ